MAWRRLIPIVLCVAACGQPASRFKEPPADSFVQQSHLVKTGSGTSSLPGAAVTKDFFSSANAQPLLGRFFIDGDFAPIARSTVVLSHHLWTEGFASSPAVIGQETQVDDHRATIVGVAPKGFDIPSGAEYWIAKR